MTIAKQEEKLSSAFRQALALSSKVDVKAVKYTDLKQWDSVAHLMLVAAVEDAFSVRLDPGEIVEMNSYGKAVTILQKHGVWPNE